MWWAAGMTLKVLIADDNPSVREETAKLIAGQDDMEVAGQAADGDETIAMAERLCPDVVLLDIAMPSMNGIAAARRILELCPTTRIVCLSVYDRAAMADLMLAAGAAAYVEKTDPADVLLAAIRGTR